MKQDVRKELTGALIWAGAMVVLAVGAGLAQKLGYLDRDTVIRVTAAPTGLYLAWYGNRMPKTFFPAAWARQARRVAGWSMVLSGLVYAGLWAFAPVPVAIPAGIAAIVAGLVVNVGNCLAVRARANAT